MRRFIAGLLMLAAVACMFAPSTRFTEDVDTIRLARVIYALGKAESYETKLALGSVAMNRVDDPWFPDDLGAVLADQQQFPAGKRYDADSLRAAHALISGERALPETALYYQSADATQPRTDATLATSGNYRFFSSAL